MKWDTNQPITWTRSAVTYNSHILLHDQNFSQRFHWSMPGWSVSLLAISFSIYFSMDSYFVCLEGIKSKLVTHFCHRKTPSYGMIRLFLHFYQYKCYFMGKNVYFLYLKNSYLFIQQFQWYSNKAVTYQSKWKDEILHNLLEYSPQFYLIHFVLHLYIFLQMPTWMLLSLILQLKQSEVVNKIFKDNLRFHFTVQK